MKQRSHTMVQRFAEPVLLGAFSIGGLVGALVGDGWSKTLGDLALTFPLVSILRHLFRSMRAQDKSSRRFE